DDEIVVRVMELVEGGRAVFGRADDVALHAEEVGQDVSDELLIIDDEDAGALVGAGGPHEVSGMDAISSLCDSRSRNFCRHLARSADGRAPTRTDARGRSRFGGPARLSRCHVVTLPRCHAATL